MRIVMFAPANANPLEIVGPLEVFAEANRHLGQSSYDVLLVGETSEPIACAGGLRVLPNAGIAEVVDDIDTLLVVGTGDVPAIPGGRTTEWLRTRSKSVRRYGAVCTGAFLLGHAGLIAGRHVTTHWEFVGDLAREFPEAIIDPDRIYTRDGPLFTSAGATGAIDLALALVEEDHGRALSVAIARRLLVYPERTGGQSQFSQTPSGQATVRTPIQQVHQWIRENPAADLSIDAVARRAAMSRRNFARVFLTETGMTPAAFVRATRLDVARRLLEETRMSTQAIAMTAGFKTADVMRRTFLKSVGVTPQDYRARFRKPPQASALPPGASAAPPPLVLKPSPPR